MTPANINIFTPGVLNIDGIYTGHSWQILLERFEDDKTTPEDWDGIYSFVICSDSERRIRVLVLAEGSGIEITGNRMVLDRTKILNILRPGQYFYDLHDDIDIDNSVPFIRGTLNVKASR